MSKFLVVCCDDDATLESIATILRIELSSANYDFKIAEGGDKYYALEELASDATQGSVIDVRTPAPEDEE